MKLYYAPGACSLSPHIALREAGIDADLIKVDTKTHRLENGGDYYGINAKGYVPTLELDDGQRLTEGPAIVQYIADRKPASRLAPAAGTTERYRLQEWLNFITSEIHKQFSPLFAADTPDEYKAIAKQKIAKRFDWLAEQLLNLRRHQIIFGVETFLMSVNRHLLAIFRPGIEPEKSFLGSTLRNRQLAPHPRAGRGQSVTVIIRVELAGLGEFDLLGFGR